MTARAGSSCGDRCWPQFLLDCESHRRDRIRERLLHDSGLVHLASLENWRTHRVFQREIATVSSNQNDLRMYVHTQTHTDQTPTTDTVLLWFASSGLCRGWMHFCLAMIHGQPHLCAIVVIQKCACPCWNKSSFFCLGDPRICSHDDFVEVGGGAWRTRRSSYSPSMLPSGEVLVADAST